VTLSEKDNLILEAALEFGADYYYNIKNGTLGPTLYIDAPNRAASRRIREDAPCFWKGLYVVVLYTTDPDFERDALYDPKLS
jgi:hypothetical protein